MNSSSSVFLVALICTAMWASNVESCAEKTLRVTAFFGFNLPDKDPGPGKSDPYIQFTARTCDGMSTTLSTTVIPDADTPVWSEVLDFGVGEWRSLTVVILDEDGAVDQPLTERHKYSLRNGDVKSIEMICDVPDCPPNGFVLFEYEIVS